MSRWRVALRIASRDALAHKVRSALVLLLVGLPVLVVTASLVIGRTADVDAVEGLDRTLGNADALVEAQNFAPVVQSADPTNGWYESGSGDEYQEMVRPGVEKLAQVLGPDVRTVPIARSEFSVRASGGEVVYAYVREFDTADAMTAPLFERVSGELPSSRSEVVVNQEYLDDLKVAVGDEIVLPGAPGPVTIIGVIEDADVLGSPVVIGQRGAILASGATPPQWLVDAGDDITWNEVEKLNALGFTVTSRAVISDPPGEAVDPYNDTYSDEFGIVIALIVVMVVLEVALLAGPAFAVTARQQSRTLALIASTGGTPAQARAVVIGQGAVLGVGAAVAGALLGIVAGLLLLRPAQWVQGWQRFGPVDIPWLWIVPVVLIGAGSVLIAAIVPAWLTARQDPVAALAGRRAEGNPDLRNPLYGLLLVGVGIAGTVWVGTTSRSNSEVMVAFSTIIVVLGMILIVPVILVWLSKAVAGWSLPVRFAARDAARHRSRTVPAVAAVAATVAGVVAVGIANASDYAQQEETYVPSLAHGASSITWYVEAVEGEDTSDLDTIADTYARVAADLGVDAVPITGLSERYDDSQSVSWAFYELDQLGKDGEEAWWLDGFGSSYGSSVLVTDDAQFLAVDEEQQQIAQEALDAGRVVVLTNHDDASPRDVVLRQTTSTWSRTTGEEAAPENVDFRVPATFVHADANSANFRAVVPPALAQETKMATEVVGLYAADGLDREGEKKLTKALGAESMVVDPNVYTERGYEGNDLALVMVLLGAAGGVLMLVGTLTATFLALSDARPDLATMGAVGASPRTRRGVGAAYALLVAGVGAVLGGLIGLVPGWAAARVLTLRQWDEQASTDPYFVIPWPLLGTVLVVLPLLTAAVIWLSARSRLPMVARID